MYLVKTPLFIQKFYSSLTWNIDSQDSVYLTFDDGPGPVATPWVLDQLQAYEAKATFFCIGENAMKYPKLLDRIESEGHTLGNHSFSHLSGWTTKTDRYLADIDRCSDVINSNLFRPPYGRLKPSQLKKLIDRYQIVMWDIMCGDFEKDISPEKCLSNITENAKPGSIILMHDSQQSIEKLKSVLPKVLAFFEKEGLKFKPIPTSN